jgi:signal transduction histidine kinase
MTTAVTTRVDRVNILLVDDQPSRLLTYEAILDELGENLITAGSATEALACLLRHEIAVVLVDVCMPDLDGYELARMIRQHPRCQKTSIIFVSGVLMTDLDRLRGYERGGVDYVSVPVVPEILRAKVSVFAELYRKTRALERLNGELEQRVAERTAALEESTAALRDADNRKDEFLAMLAHELRNPLAPIRTAVQLLRQKELPPPKRERACEIMERQVEHLVRLIDDLLDVSRITRGMISLRREAVSIGAVIAGAVETARPGVDARRQHVTVELPEEPVAVEGDTVRLVQVIGNVLHNAVKFTDVGGHISLKVTTDGPDAFIRIRDTGIGIAKEQLPRIFNLFAQAHSQSVSSQGGLGIGLALAQRLVAMHGGTVTAHSDGLGHGTEFTIRLPRMSVRATKAAVESPLSEPIPTLPSRRILVVDDNNDAAESLATFLEHQGHEVRIAYDGEEALASGEAFRPHAVLLDLGMPRMNGYETARQLRRRPWGTQATLIAVTGWGPQQQDRRRSLESGFDFHLVKPVAESELLRVLASVGASCPPQ